MKQQIILGVTGSVAAYKSMELARLLVKSGADVRVVLSAGGQAFITPLSFQAVTGNKVETQLLDETADSTMNHITLARWADKIIIAPASANIIARLAHGFADDLLSTLCLVSKAPLFLAPAMNKNMWQHSATQANIDTLKKRAVNILGPDIGEQACGEKGPGRMLEPADLLTALNTPC
jgi:phosphopantothenoylcysteine decarboxylase / phosphopantothenate---cysteine ligase